MYFTSYTVAKPYGDYPFKYNECKLGAYFVQYCVPIKALNHFQAD